MYGRISPSVYNFGRRFSQVDDNEMFLDIVVLTVNEFRTLSN